MYQLRSRKLLPHLVALFLITAHFSSIATTYALSGVDIRLIGSSPKGQFIATEEINKNSRGLSTRILIRVQNVWSNKEVFYRELNLKSKIESKALFLKKRKSFIDLAKKDLLKFNIGKKIDS